MVLFLIKSWIKLLSLFSPKKATQLSYKLFCTPFNKKKVLSEHILKAEKKIHLIGGNNIHTYEWITPHATGTVILLHGWESDSSFMAHLSEPLNAAGLSVIAVDATAHGSSSGQTTTIYEYATLIKKIKEIHSDIKYAIAHSFGGAALMLASEEFKLHFESVFLIATPSSTEKIFTDFNTLLDISKSLEENIRSHISSQLGRPIESLGIENLNTQNYIKDIFVIHDTKDKKVPFVNAEIIKQKWNNVQLLTIENVGHYRIIKDELLTSSILKELQNSTTVSV